MNYGLSNFSSYCYSVLKIKKKKPNASSNSGKSSSVYKDHTPKPYSTSSALLVVSQEPFHM